MAFLFLLAQAFGVSNDHVPNGVHLSPRVGLSWTYGTTTQTNPGTGTHTVTCTLGGVTQKATAPFSVP